MEDLTINDLLAIISLIGASGGGIVFIWRAFTFFSAVKDKVDKTEFEQHKSEIKSELLDVRHLLNQLKDEVGDKVDTVQFELMKKDLEYLKERMVTKDDFNELKTLIKLKLLKQNEPD